MKEVIEHLERMAETLDGVDEENWIETPEDIAQIYRSVANEIRQKMSESTAVNFKELLGEVYDLIDKSKSYSKYIESIDRKREFSRYLTKAKNLVDNIINQELSANVSVGNVVDQFRDVTKKEQPNKVENAENNLIRLNLIRLNMANARDALRKVISLYKSWASSGEVANNYLMCACHIAMDALAAPPRNCDMFNTLDEAFRSYCEDKGITKPLPLWYGDEFWEFINWLFAKAKGEVK